MVIQIAMRELADDVKESLMKGVPIVGLINQITGQIILAPCIQQQVELKLNENQEVIAGHLFTNQNSSLTGEQISTYNELFKKGHVPRMGILADGQKLTSHEFLFNNNKLLQNEHPENEKKNWGALP
jgi:hypothetical protein